MASYVYKLGRYRNTVLFKHSPDFFRPEARRVIFHKEFIPSIGQAGCEQAINGMQAGDLLQIAVVQNAG